MQPYQIPSAEYSTYINHVISLGLAEDYIAQLRASCSPNSTPSLRAAIDQACRHLSGLVDDLKPVPVSAPSVHSPLNLQYSEESQNSRQLHTLLALPLHLRVCLKGSILMQDVRVDMGLGD